MEDDSDTETYFFIKAYIDNDRWRGVPFYIEGGKNLEKRESSVTVRFKPSDSCVCRGSNLQDYQNVLKITVEPQQLVNIRFWTKQQGLGFKLSQQDVEFFQPESTEYESTYPYKKVIYDSIQGDQTLFVSTDEVKSAWKFITPIIEGWDDTDLHIYEPESTGPDRVEIPDFDEE